jgi:uncharacterized protein YndB with AHSA1/START domain
MNPITTTRMINAPIDMVFKSVSDINVFADVLPHIVEIEILSDIKSGLGTRFRETRLMKGKEATTVLEITELEPNSLVRMVADEGGTIWDTVMATSEEGGQTKLTMVMEARPHKIMSRLITPMIMGMVAKAVASDMDAVKEYCEKNT